MYLLHMVVTLPYTQCHFWNTLWGVSHSCSLEGYAASHMAGHVQVDDPFLQRVKTLIRYTEARSAAGVCGVSNDRCIFLDMPFYQTGEDSQQPVSIAMCTRQAAICSVSRSVCQLCVLAPAVVLSMRHRAD